MRRNLFWLTPLLKAPIGGGWKCRGRCAKPGVRARPFLSACQARLSAGGSGTVRGCPVSDLAHTSLRLSAILRKLGRGSSCWGEGPRIVGHLNEILAAEIKASRLGLEERQCPTLERLSIMICL